MLDSKALTKIQSIILITIIVVVAIGGGVAYVLLSGEEQSSDTIKIGVLADLDNWRGECTWEGAVLAAEQINAEGGILGRRIELIGEDDDSEIAPIDATKISTALTKLLTLHKVDFIISGTTIAEGVLIAQDLYVQLKKICLSIVNGIEVATQRVLDDYDKYKYFFRIYPGNDTSIVKGMVDSILQLRELTGFNKIGLIGHDSISTTAIFESYDFYLSEVYNFDLAYAGKFPADTFDFSSYLAAAEEAGTQMLITGIGGEAGILLVKEWYDRQSPMVMWGVNSMAKESDFWDITDGKCENIVFNTLPVTVSYPLTSKTLPMRKDYIERWGHEPISSSAAAYDALRFILSGAIERAGTIETESVIKSLEDTSVETSMVRNFVFTSSHDVMVGENPNNPDDPHLVVLMFQWQANETRVPVYPNSIMEEAGATYTFPDWPGPWDNLD